MAINFPDSPSVNDTHTVGSRTWKWDGTVWNLVLTTAAYTTLVDADGDTKIQVEETADEDVIRFDVAGTEYVTIDNTGLVSIAQNAEVDGTLTANHIHGNIAGSVYLHVKNTSGSSIAAGSPVYATGSVGASGATEIAASDASTSSTMPAIGIIQTTLANNAEGHATLLGVIGSLDTSTYSLNQPLYVAPGGGLTATRPTAASDKVQSIARVVRVDGSTGELLVLGAGRTNDVPNEIEIAGDLTVDTDTLYVDSANDRVGVNTASPAVALDVVGTTDTDYLTVGGENVTPYTGKRNLLINGAMQVYQRASSGAVLASEGYRCADRWKSYRTVNAAGTLSVNTTDAPEGFNNSLNYACTSAEATPTNETFVSQVLEGQDVQHIGYG